jgi:uncharacterized protein
MSRDNLMVATFHDLQRMNIQRFGNARFYPDEAFHATATAIHTRLNPALIGSTIARYNPTLCITISSRYRIDMNPIISTMLLLIASNVFMTFAWYGHLKNLGSKPLIVAVLVSWGIALFEYLLQVPANRIGFGKLTLPQLKMLQEIITLSVFVPFSVFYMRQTIRIDFLWAALCMCGAVYFMFRGVPISG